MKKIEEIRKELSVCKEIIEENLARLDRLEEKEEGAVMLKLAFSRTVQQAELYNVERGELRIKDPYVGSHWGVTIRTTGPLAGKAFYLNEDMYDWELARDKESRLCLVPIKKEK